MDSLTEDSKQGYQKLGVAILVREDQMSTDCEKALAHIEQVILPSVSGLDKKKVRIAILGAFGGRMDHTMQNINVLWRKARGSTNIEYLMFDSHNIMCVLKQGHNTFNISNKAEARKGCGVVPLTECTSITTSGLLYDMGKCSSHT